MDNPETLAALGTYTDKTKHNTTYEAGKMSNTYLIKI
jgi:hypothetical protein